jgi:hypothetical protein
MGWSGMDWSHLAQDRDKSRAIVGKFFNSCITCGFSGTQFHRASNSLAPKLPT